jgi:nicotinamidase/pyrazinamidase
MRKILLVIDMQNDFIDGALGTGEAAGIVDRVVSVIRAFPSRDIFATRDTHSENYLSTEEGKHLPVVHCIRGTAGWQLNPKVQAALRDAEIIDKPSFGSVELAEKMKRLAETEPIEITMIGLCTDICVISNALLLKAYIPETEISVIRTCCAGVTKESHEAALTAMKMCQVNITG